MKKLGFLLVAGMLISSAVSAAPASSNYTNVAVALAETAVASSWATQPKFNLTEIDNAKLDKQVEMANDKLNKALEQRLSERLELTLVE